MKCDPGIQTVLPWYEGQPELQPCEPPEVCTTCGGTAYVSASGICEDCLDSFYACHPAD